MLLGAVINTSNNKIALDIGAGTGVLALMLAQRNSSIKITCVEIDQKSAEECKNNVKISPWFNRIETINAEFTQYDFQQKFDLIFTNPPYYLTNNSSSESNERTKHITPEALQSWLNKIADLLTKKGDFWMIWPSETSQKLLIWLMIQVCMLQKKSIFSAKKISCQGIYFALIVKKRKCLTNY